MKDIKGTVMYHDLFGRGIIQKEDQDSYYVIFDDGVKIQVLKKNKKYSLGYKKNNNIKKEGINPEDIVEETPPNKSMYDYYVPSMTYDENNDAYIDTDLYDELYK